MSKLKQTPSRRYPPFLEKLIPILLGMIVLMMVILLVIAVAVAMGWIG